MKSVSSLRRYYEKRLLPLRKKVASGKILNKKEKEELERIDKKFCRLLRVLPEPVRLKLREVEEIIDEIERNNYCLEADKYSNDLLARFDKLYKQREDSREGLEGSASTEEKERLKKEIEKVTKEIRRVGKRLRFVGH